MLIDHLIAKGPRHLHANSNEEKNNDKIQRNERIGNARLDRRKERDNQQKQRRMNDEK